MAAREIPNVWSSMADGVATSHLKKPFSDFIRFSRCIKTRHTCVIIFSNLNLALKYMDLVLVRNHFLKLVKLDTLLPKHGNHVSKALSNRAVPAK